MKKLTFTFCLLMACTLAGFSQTTYYWVGGLGPTSYTSTSNWNTQLDGSGDSRSVLGAAVTDILIFDGSNVGGATPVTGNVVATASSQACAQIKLLNNANIWISRSATGSAAITVNGDAGTDLLVEAGSTLTLGGPLYNYDVSMVLSAAATASISGNVYLSPISTSIHTRSFMTAAAAGNLVFETGSNCYITDSTATSGFNASVAGGVVFKTGASLYYYAGRSPIGSNSTTQFTTFEPGSNLYFMGSNVSYLDGTTAYTSSSWVNQKLLANVFVQNGANLNADGSIYKMENLTVATGSSMRTHTSGVTVVLGNLAVDGTLFAPSGSTNTLSMSGNSPQLISGTGAINTTNFAVGNHSDVSLAKNVSVDLSANIVGRLNFGTSSQLTGAGTFTSRVGLSPTATVSATGTTTAGSHLVTGVSALTGITATAISGTGIAAGTNVAGFATGIVLLSKPATASGSSTFTFYADSATLITANANGMDAATGSVIVADVKNYQSGTNYIINAATPNPFGISSGAGSSITAGNVTFNAAATTNYNVKLTGTLTLGAGVLTIRPTDTVRILSGNDIAGAPFSAGKYIVSNVAGANAGVLRLDNFSTPKLFPIGTATNYLPATLTPASTSDFAISVFEGVTADGTPTGAAITPAQKATVVDAVWTIDRVNGSGDSQVDLNWTTPLEGSSFTNYTDAEIGIGRYNGTDWGTATGSGNNTTNTASGLFNTFSPFIVTKLGSALPLQLRNVAATIKAVGVEITWNVLNEEGVVRYEIEKSSNRTQFTTIGTVQASNKSTYQFTDLAAQSNLSYYRLKITSSNGQVRYSDILAVKSGVASAITMYPNPVVNSLNVTGLSNATTIKIFNATGQLVAIERTTANSVSLDVASLKPGVYVLQVLRNGEVATQQRFIRQ